MGGGRGGRGGFAGGFSDAMETAPALAAPGLRILPLLGHWLGLACWLWWIEVADWDIIATEVWRGERKGFLRCRLGREKVREPERVFMNMPEPGNRPGRVLLVTSFARTIRDSLEA